MKKIILLVAIGLSSLLLAEGISGVSYFQYSINKIGTIEESRGFELNRVYLTYENIISDKLSYKFQSDMQNNGDAYYNRGHAFTKLKKYEDAIADYTRAIRVDSDHSDSYMNRGIVKGVVGLSSCSDFKKACDLGKELCCEWYKQDNCK